MDIFNRALQFTFHSRTLGDEFLKRIRNAVYKYDVIIVNDILTDRKEPTLPEGYHYGYDRKTVRKLKVEKENGAWIVRFPRPGKMVRDHHGYWTTEAVDIPENPDSGGGS